MRRVLWGRVSIAATWVALQAALVLTAGGRPDFAFGFRMFNESSTLNVHLRREVDSVTGHGMMLVDADHGEWVARDARGELHRFSVRDRIHEPGLSIYDATIHASYGADAQVARLRSALEDVATHLDGDTETHALVMSVTVRRNGREPHIVEMRAEVSPSTSGPSTSSGAR